MLKIIDNDQLVVSMQLAQETQTENQLIRWLLYLSKWHSEDKTEVRITADIPRSPECIMWSAHHIENGVTENECFYNGGLIFFHDRKEWSIHS
jgi:hypothetical protein